MSIPLNPDADAGETRRECLSRAVEILDFLSSGETTPEYRGQMAQVALAFIALADSVVYANTVTWRVAS